MPSQVSDEQASSQASVHVRDSTGVNYTIKTLLKQHGIKPEEESCLNCDLTAGTVSGRKRSHSALLVPRILSTPVPPPPSPAVTPRRPPSMVPSLDAVMCMTSTVEARLASLLGSGAASTSLDMCRLQTRLARLHKLSRQYEALHGLIQQAYLSKELHMGLELAVEIVGGSFEDLVNFVDGDLFFGADVNGN